LEAFQDPVPPTWPLASSFQVPDMEVAETEPE